MFNLPIPTLFMIVAVGLFTIAAAYMDTYYKRIPNKLTIPMFFAGWVFQIIMSFMYGWSHLGSAALGFAVGFGIFFVLFFVGGSGGGDVKLIGALSVWLGFQLTLYTLLVATLLVMISTTCVVVSNLLRHGVHKTRSKYLATGKTPAGQKPKKETASDKLNRRVMAFAGPVALATWLVICWNLPRLNPEAQAAEEKPVPNAPATEQVEQPEIDSENTTPESATEAAPANESATEATEKETPTPDSDNTSTEGEDA